MRNNVGELIDELFRLRNEKDDINGQLKTINEQISSVEYSIITAMEEQGIQQTRTGAGSVSMKVEMYPQVEDLHELVAWAYHNGRADILQKRVASGVFKEIFEDTGMFPEGIKTYEKKTLNVRRA